MSKKDKKKTGMVLIIGMGVKPKKGKGSLKKEEKKKRKIVRGGEGAKVARNLKELKQLRGLDEAGIDEYIKNRKLDPQETHGKIMQQFGKPIEELLQDEKTGLQVADFLLDEGSKAFEARRGKREEMKDKTARNIRELTTRINEQKDRQVFNPQDVEQHIDSLSDEEKAAYGMSNEKFKALIDSVYRATKKRKKQLRGDMYHNFLRRRLGESYKTPDEVTGMRDDEEARGRGDDSSIDDEEYNRILRLLLTRREPNPEETAELTVREGRGGTHIVRPDRPTNPNRPGKEEREMMQAPSSFIQGDNLGNFGKPSHPHDEAYHEPDIHGIGYNLKSSPIDAAIDLLKQGEDYGDVADALNQMPRNELDKVRMEQIQRLLGFTNENRMKRAKRDLGLTGGQKGRMERTPSNFSPGEDGDSPRRLAQFSGHPNLASPTGRLPGREPAEDPLASLRMPDED